MSAGPPEWIEHWLRNQFGLFNNEADAIKVVPAADRDGYCLFAYRSYPEIFQDGEDIALTIPADVRPEAVSPAFRSLGFHVVSKSITYTSGFECSPLSCNSMAKEVDGSEHCLISDVRAAFGRGSAVLRGKPEPGVYYVIEDLEKPPV